MLSGVRKTSRVEQISGRYIRRTLVRNEMSNDLSIRPFYYVLLCQERSLTACVLTLKHWRLFPLHSLRTLVLSC